MDLDQLQKRVQWIDEDRRKEKDALALLESRVVGYDGALNALGQQIKDLSSEINRLASIVTRMDQFDDTISQLRLETRRSVEELSKEIKRREEEANKVRLVDTKSQESALFDLRKEIEILPRLEQGLQTRSDEANRLNRLIEETRERIENVRREEEEYTRTMRLLEDGRRQDAKRIQDAQGEVLALRKRADDQRGQIEIVNMGMRKLDTRLNDLVNVEAERRDTMSSFLDKQNLVQVERDRTWKEWQARFETIEQQAAEAEAKLLTLDATQREARRMQTVLEELVQRVDRRINEITEIQRLSEDRFRQEWVTFKADDQKRWTNYTLTQEEQRSEILRQFDRFGERSNTLEDNFQEMHDVLTMANEETQNRLQTLLNLVHEWSTSFERTVGKSSR